jgi:hypothetical protein
LHYNWKYLSVLCEDEHPMQPEQGVEYTVCYDAWKLEIAKVNPSIVLVGPEFYLDHVPYYTHFLNGSNHDDGQSPPVISSHCGLNYDPDHPAVLFDQFDSWFSSQADPMEARRQRLAPQAKTVMNEFVPFVEEWCSEPQFPNPELKNSSGIRINRATLGWSAAAAVFANAFGRLSELGYTFVTADQLVAGPYPDNEPYVSALDWTTGEPNAKYWVTRMLANAFGKRNRTLYSATVQHEGGPPTATPCRPSAAANIGRTQCDTRQLPTANHSACQAACCADSSCIAWSWDNQTTLVAPCETSTNPQGACCWMKNCAGVKNHANAPGVDSWSGDSGRETLPALYAQGFELDGERGVLLVNQRNTTLAVSVAAAVGSSWHGALLEGVGTEPGFVPPRQVHQQSEDEPLVMGAYGVALLWAGNV